MQNQTAEHQASTEKAIVPITGRKSSAGIRRARAKPPAVDLIAKKIRVDVLRACRSALEGLDYKNDRAFAAAVQIAIAGANLSANELGRALGYDTATIIKWYQAQMAPRRGVARQEVIEVIKVILDRLLTEWEQAHDSIDGIRRMNLRTRSSPASLRWKAAEAERA